jgi:hypothetical protein
VETIGRVFVPNRNKRVCDAARILAERRREAHAMLALWEKSTNPGANDEMRHLRGARWESMPADCGRPVHGA